ncbi:MAG: phytase [Pseudomonadota bacterium]|nr:phytase [Pseudomonadota bacterium]
MTTTRLATAFATALVMTMLGGCMSTPSHDSSISRAHAVAASAPSTAVLTVAEAFVSADSLGDELDSLATWPTEDGKTWVIATAKASHRLVVFDGDSGDRLRDFGTRGAAAGQFNRPNGIAVHGDLLFVVERDNRRVQVLHLPEFNPVAMFGSDELRSPYGIWLHETAPGELEAYVTDSFMYGERFDVVPPLTELNQRVRRYRLLHDTMTSLATLLRARYLGSFGDTTAANALRMVESIAGDPANDRLLIADEDRRHVSTLREYSFAGDFTRRSLPEASFGAEAEGVALWSCPDGSGYWIAVDQLAPLAVFHLFDRTTLAPRGSFRGALTSYTDGIALHAAGSRSFPGGALYAVHADKAVSAFDLREVARMLELPAGCTG